MDEQLIAQLKRIKDKLDKLGEQEGASKQIVLTSAQEYLVINDTFSFKKPIWTDNMSDEKYDKWVKDYEHRYLLWTVMRTDTWRVYKTHHDFKAYKVVLVTFKRPQSCVGTLSC